MRLRFLLSRYPVYRVCTRVSFVVVGHLGASDRPIERSNNRNAQSRLPRKSDGEQRKWENWTRARGGREETALSLLSRVRPTKPGPLPFASKKRNSADGLIDCCLTILDYRPVGPAEIGGSRPPVTIAERIAPPGRRLPKPFPVAFIDRFCID